MLAADGNRMSSVNVQTREVAAKVVFYGPGLSGKTTTLKKIYESVRPANRGEMMSLATEGDRTLFFDFLPVRIERLGDFLVRLALYTVPGQVFYNATRKLVLKGADGVVFVADSQPEAMNANRESLENLKDNLLEQGIDFEHFPLVYEWNKRDVPQAMPVTELRAQLNPKGLPDFETSAAQGVGILEMLKTITRLVIQDLKSKRVVPSPLPKDRPSPLYDSISPASLEKQIQAHLQDLPRSNLGPVSALTPPSLLHCGSAVDAAFARGDWEGCVGSCQEATRQALAWCGEYPIPLQAYLLGLDGQEFLRFRSIQGKGARSEDAAFCVYFVMRVMVALRAGPLHPPG